MLIFVGLNQKAKNLKAIRFRRALGSIHKPVDLGQRPFIFSLCLDWCIDGHIVSALMRS